MTPERLQEIRDRYGYRWAIHQPAESKQAFLDRDDLLDYIDTLHEDLRLTRAERDKTKRDCLVYRKENAALRRGQGRAAC